MDRAERNGIVRGAAGVGGDVEPGEVDEHAGAKRSAQAQSRAPSGIGTDSSSASGIIPVEDDEALGPIGRLAAELAHDLNNQLAAVLNYSFLLERQVDPTLSGHVEELQQSAWRASAIASRLKAFGRPRQGEERAIELPALLHSMRPLLTHLGGEHRVRAEIPLALPEVAVSESALEQLIVAVLATGAARGADNCELVIFAHEVAGKDSEGPRVRLGCRFDARKDGVQATATAATGRFDRASMHGILKRADARPGHNDGAVWADLRAARAVGSADCATRLTGR